MQTIAVKSFHFSVNSSKTSSSKLKTHGQTGLNKSYKLVSYDALILGGRRAVVNTPVSAFQGLTDVIVIAKPVVELGKGILPVAGPWGVWAVLVICGAVGVWSERTRLGKELSGALVATLAGMVAVNVGMLPTNAPELKIVYKFILPLAIPLLLFSANLRRVISETGRLLPAFLLGSITTVLGSLAAYLIMPLGRFIGEDGWRVASALTARHIGGAVNYMAVTESLEVSPSIFGAGLAADDLILTLYFTAIYSLARALPPDSPPQQGSGVPPIASSSSTSSSSSTGCNESINTTSCHLPPQDAQLGVQYRSREPIQVESGLLALAFSVTICYLSYTISQAMGIAGQFITVTTAITVILATALPTALAPLAPSAQGMAQILMQIFYATIGASANVGLVISTAPVLFVFSFIALAGHLVLILGLGAALGFTRRDVLLASHANIGGPTTVAGMAAAKGWTSSIVPSILTATLGYALGTFTGMALGHICLKLIL
ncbi:hypothetical protein CEUSTIGMA_g13700.t1 [Chlamydomonas eustigma]|uniref:DUF819 domain-containing protein n=1 Tax=Chlamydomonas eustigma TaxID=1157962 RepID=A0A250XTA1_9CHLO|nr:hypothetical protein CEUSTIGMA_g13700.t1 [Chlamydomonas eustigma]|eukprot:GAX86288.1 hypothetical protein CEUSTIGMA_g13700.t1 [Chlamydomonas eustigma]